MYSYIKGIIKIIDQNSLVVENNGIGYFVSTSSNTVDDLKDNYEMIIYTHMYVREDNISLFGFSEENELEMFRLLIKVSGVGPKAALSILSLGNIIKLEQAIITGNSSYIAEAQGIGKKTANKVILELKDKISDTEQEDEIFFTAAKDKSSHQNAVEALISLGFKFNEINKTISSLNLQDKTEEEIIKKVLKNIGK